MKKLFILNLSYAFIANIIVLVSSTIITLLLPKFMGIENYAYWQLYVLYTTYTAFFHLGWNDGIYLEYGGVDYSGLNKNKLFSQFVLLIFLNIILVLVVNIVCLFNFNINEEKLLILRLMTFSTLITVPRGFLMSVLQATNRIKDNSFITILEKIVFITLVFIIIIFKINNFYVLVFSDIVSKLFSYIWIVYICRDIVIRKLSYFSFQLSEIIHTIFSGMKISIAYIASTLIVNTIRLFIEKSWSVVIFGQISLILSLSNLVTVFVNSIGLVIFPIIRKKNNSELIYLYQSFRNIFTEVSLLGLSIYFPLKWAMEIWLPNYSEGLKYLLILFPICIFDGKMAMIFTIFFKSLRKENTLLMINLVTLIFSVILSFIFTILLKDLLLSVMLILIVLAFRSVISEIYLSKYLNIKYLKNIVTELLIVFWFLIICLNLDLLKGYFIYISSIFMYLFVIRNSYLKRMIYEWKNKKKS